MFVFQKFWYGLFSCNNHFETSRFALLLKIRVLFHKREFHDSVKTTFGNLNFEFYLISLHE